MTEDSEGNGKLPRWKTICPDAVQRGYVGKAHPTPYQKECLHKLFRLRKDVFNACLYIACKRWKDKDSSEDNKPKLRPGPQALCEKWWSDALTNMSAESRAAVEAMMSPDKPVSWRYLATYMRDGSPALTSVSTWITRAAVEDFEASYKAFWRRFKELSRNPDLYSKLAARFLQRRGRNPTRFELAGFPCFQYYSDPPFTVGHRLTVLKGDGYTTKPATSSAGSLVKEPIGKRWRLRMKDVGLDPDDPTSPDGILVRFTDFPSTPRLTADMTVRYDGKDWSVSVSGYFDRRRFAPQGPSAGEMHVVFGDLDHFCTVNGSPVGDNIFGAAFDAMYKVDVEKSLLDTRYPPKERGKLTEDQWAEVNSWKSRIRQMQSYASRVKRDVLHKWSTEIVARATRLNITVFPVQEFTASGKGSAAEWGANVSTKAALNRLYLSRCTYAARLMLEYKARESLGDDKVQVIKDALPQAVIGSRIVQAAKTVRKAKRSLTQQEV